MQPVFGGNGAIVVPGKWETCNVHILLGTQTGSHFRAVCKLLSPFKSIHSTTYLLFYSRGGNTR